jgi:hypothetical protein
MSYPYSTFQLFSAQGDVSGTSSGCLNSITGITEGCVLAFGSTLTSTNSTGICSIQQSSQMLMINGFPPFLDTSGASISSGSQACDMFEATINFQLTNPIFTDDENDAIYLFIVLPSKNSAIPFNVQCYLSNMGSMVSTPIYTVTASKSTSTYPIITIPLNKWFAFRSPGSIYQVKVCGTQNFTYSSYSSTNGGNQISPGAAYPFTASQTPTFPYPCSTSTS